MNRTELEEREQEALNSLEDAKERIRQLEEDLRDMTKLAVDYKEANTRLEGQTKDRTMTDSEINKAIARLCGWGVDVTGVWYPPSGDKCSPIPPQYCLDLNAMHAAEKLIYYDTGMAEERAEQYEDNLRKLICSQLGYDGAYTLCHASARQRAEAFLITVGQWKIIETP